MASDLTILVQDTIADTKRSVERLRQAIMGREIVTSIGRRLTEDTLSTVVRNTPRAKYHHDQYSQRRGNQPIAGDWTAQVLSSARNEQFRAIVSNAAADTTEGQIILRSLEGGAAPHTMPRAGGSRDKPYVFSAESTRLKFLGRETIPPGSVIDRIQRRESGRGLIFRTHINHPGHKPFAMVARTMAHMDPIAASVILRVADQIAAAWSFGASVGEA